MTYVPPLTDRQRRIWEFIRAHIDEHDYPPTFRQIGQHMGLASLSSVHHQLSALEAKGYLRRNFCSPRSLTLLDPRERLSDDDRIAISLTRREWRDVHRGLGDFWPATVGPLWEALERLDLGEVA